MSLISDDAVVIGRLDYSETSQVLVLFAREHGKVRAIAKGVKRSTKTRFSPGIDLLDVGRIVVSNRSDGTGLATLTEWKQTRCFSGLREKLVRLHAGQYAAEIVAHLTEDRDPHAALYDVFLATLELLAHSEEALSTLVRYQVALLTAIGSLPRFDRCVSCGRLPGLTHFSSHQGGVICRNCEPGQMEKREMSAATLAALRRVGGANGERSDGGTEFDGRGKATIRPECAVGAFDILDYHIAHLMSREPALSPLIVRPEERRRAQAATPSPASTDGHDGC